MLRMRLKMATKRKSTGCCKPEKKKRAMSLLEFGYVWQNTNPAAMPIRYTSSAMELSMTLLTNHGAW